MNLTCVNSRGLVWNESYHGDFYPACVDPNSTLDATTFPVLDGYPRDLSICSVNDFQNFVKAGGSYQHVGTLMSNVSVFMWNVTQNHTVQGRLVVNSLFGWIAMGFRGPQSFPMFGAEILMGLPGGNYSIQNGLDLSLGPMTHEYTIGNEASYFLWGAPSSSVPPRSMAVLSSQAEESPDGCFTSLTFEAVGFVSSKFNLNGTNTMIWAANGEDSFVQWHGQQRGVFVIDWASGDVTSSAAAPAVPTNAPVSSPSSGESGTPTSAGAARALLVDSYLLGRCLIVAAAAAIVMLMA